MNLSPNFTLAELTRTNHAELAAQNTALAMTEPGILAELRQTAHALELVRALFNRPILVHSGFRCEELNEAVGGSPTSQHRVGQAVDFTVEGMDLEDTLHTIQAGGIPFHQLLIEDACIHIGTWQEGKPNGEVAYWKAGVKTEIQEPTA